jgi:hypothetical protein
MFRESAEKKSDAGAISIHAFRNLGGMVATSIIARRYEEP